MAPMAWLVLLPRVGIAFCISCISVAKAFWAPARSFDCKALLSDVRSVPGVGG